jgi:uncharacterized protein YdhG (YjbR/CyaY superfamily)
MNPKPITIDDYLANVPEDQRAALEHLRLTIKSVAPQAAECISYGMPAFKYYGIVVYFAAFKNHCSLFPARSSTLTDFASELKPFTTTKGTIHFTPEQPLPDDLIRRIIEARVMQNEAKRKK